MRHRDKVVCFVEDVQHSRKRVKLSDENIYERRRAQGGIEKLKVMKRMAYTMDCQICVSPYLSDKKYEQNIQLMINFDS